MDKYSCHEMATDGAYIVVVCWGKKTNSSEYSVITLIIIIILMKKASISTLDQLTNIWFDLILCTMDSLSVCVHVCGCCWVWGKWEARATSYKTKFIDGSESGMTALFFSLSLFSQCFNDPKLMDFLFVFYLIQYKHTRVRLISSLKDWKKKFQNFQNIQYFYLSNLESFFFQFYFFNPKNFIQRHIIRFLE